jgi:hypothetical protein
MFPLLLTALGLADAPVEPPPRVSAQAPQLLIAWVEKDQLTSTVEQTVAVPVTVTMKVNNNGKEEDVTVTKYVTEKRLVKHSMDLTKAKITTAGGKQLTLDDLKKRLAKPAPVVVATDGKSVDPAYLKILDRDAVVIVIDNGPKKPK